MRVAICLLCGFALVGCFPARPPASVPSAAHVAARPMSDGSGHNARPTDGGCGVSPQAVLAASRRQTPVTSAAPPQATGREIAGIVFEGVAFDSRSHRLIVADQPAGPGSRWPDAAAAAAYHGLAAINAGFFTPEGQPLGQVVAAGIPVGSWNRASSLGSGVWLEAANGMPGIRRRESVPATFAARELVQAGPMLVENHRPVSGLEATKSSVRSVILWDGGTRWWIGRASSCTLAALGQALVSGTPGAWPVCHALNFDGGRSADLAISAEVPGGPLTRRAPWNRPVRNFMVLLAR